MSYELALKAAGAEVIAFEKFGSYQGDWLAKVRYKGKELYIAGSYGSCSGCDSFEGELGYQEEKCEDHRYKANPVDCAACSAMNIAYGTKLAAFGKGYLDDPMDKDKLLEKFKGQAEWDSDSVAIIAWLEKT